MKRFAFLILLLPFFLAPHKASAQSSLEKCQQGSCYAFGPPSGSCVGAYIFSDISQTPVQAYSCKANAWVAQGGGASTQNPLTVEAEWPFNEGTGTTVADITGHGHDGTFCGSTNAPSWGVDGVHFLNSTTVIAPLQCVTTNVKTWQSISIAFEIYTGLPATGVGGLGTPYPNYPTLFGSTVNTSGVYFIGSPLGAYNLVPQQNHGGFVPGIFNAPTNITSSAANGFGQRHIVTVVAGSPDAYYIDGLPLALGKSGSSAALIPTTGIYEFGAGQIGDNLGFRGTILYASMSTSAWTPSQVLQESNYIQSKINTRTLTQWSNAASRSPSIVFPGDSLWASRSGTGVWTSVLTLNNTYTVINRGVSGITAFDIDKLAQSTWLTDVSPNSKTYVVFDGGSNELSSSAEGTWASYIESALQARAVGAIPVASTLISRTGLDTNVAAVNAIIRARWKQAGFAALLDNWERPEFATGGSTNLTFYQSDGTHLTGGTACTSATGYGLFCVGASKIINTLDGSTAATPDLSVSNAFVEVDANNYIVQTPTAAATHQLVDCSWISGMQKTVVNGSGTFTITMSTTASQTIAGKLTVAPNSSGIFTAVPTGNAGGCSWVGQ